MEMINRFVKISVILISFIFLSGFLPILSLLGPGLTIMSSGSVYKAGIQYAVNTTIKKKTGKNSLNFLSEKINKQDENLDNFNDDFKQLVERRVRIVQKKIEFKNH